MMENLHWTGEFAVSAGVPAAVIPGDCCTKAESLPTGCVTVILRLLGEYAAEKGLPELQAAVERRTAEGTFPALVYDLQDEDSLAGTMADWLELSGESRQVVGDSRCVTLGMAMYICMLADLAVKNADITLTMNLEAIRGERGAFDRRLHELGRPYPGQIQCAENVRRINEGSQMTTDEGRYAYGYDTKPRVQDAICVRAAPQTHGGVRDVLHWCQSQVLRDWQRHSRLLYRTEYAMNALATALADLTHISERRTFRLNDSKLSYGLPMSLVPDEPGINHGFAIVQSTQAAETAEVKLLTLPTAAMKRNGECLAYLAVSQQFELVKKMNRVLAVEALMSAQGMDIVRRKVPGCAFGRGSEAALHCLREQVAFQDRNRFVAPDMIRAENLISSGAILQAVETAVGVLK